MKHLLGADRRTDLQSDNEESFAYYTELGWEAIVGRLKVIRMVSEGRITRNDTIVTLPDRTFFYSKFCNVEAFDPNASYSDVNGSLHPHYYGAWLQELFVEDKQVVGWRWPEDLPLILDFDFEPVDPPPCIIINHRIRGWQANRNIKPEDTQALVSLALELGLKPYISGQNAEAIDPRAEHIGSLRKLASIMHHENCLVSFMAGGPAMMAQQCCKNTLVGLDTSGFLAIPELHAHPLFFSTLLNFSGYKRRAMYPDDLKQARQIIEEAR